MSTKHEILQASRLLFNEKGVMNVTLRDVSKSLNRSYGNITYHFPTKDAVISDLFEAMNNQFTSLQVSNDTSDLLLYLLNIPGLSYDITLKYLFFTIDYNELKRNYPELFKKINLLNNERKIKWKELLKHLRDKGSLNTKLTDEDLEYILFLSISVRSAYFQMKDTASYDKVEYIALVNQMLKPYLGSKGIAVYNKWLKKQ